MFNTNRGRRRQVKHLHIIERVRQHGCNQPNVKYQRWQNVVLETPDPGKKKGGENKQEYLQIQ